jgi:hypothetical protein
MSAVNVGGEAAPAHVSQGLVVVAIAAKWYRRANRKELPLKEAATSIISEF